MDMKKIGNRTTERGQGRHLSRSAGFTVALTLSTILMAQALLPVQNAAALSIFREITIGLGEQSDVDTNGANGNAGRIVVTNNYDNTVQTFNTNNLNAVATISVGANPVAVGVDKTLNKAFVANQDDDTVSVINLNTNTVTATIPDVSVPNSIRVNSATSKAYVTNILDDSVTVINTSTNAITAVVSVGVNPFNVAINESLNRIYVTNSGDGTVSVINGATDTVDSTWTDGISSPLGIAIDTDANKVYITNFQLGDGYVSVYNGALNTLMTTIAIGVNAEPYYISCDNTNRNECYVTNLTGESVTVIDQATDAVESTLQSPIAGISVVGLASDPNRSRAYVVITDPNTTIQTLLVINT